MIQGHTVGRLWIEEAAEIAHEYYVSFTLDRAAKLDLAMLSAEGGVDIEEVAETDPEAIARLEINPLDGLTAGGAEALVAAAGIDAAARDGVADVIRRLHRCYVEGDADLVEVNPLAVTATGEVRALDAKVILDDEAAFRHPEWSEFADAEPDDPRERAARAKGLSYVGLDGSVGIIANGAGLAMSTLDVVSQAGGAAANFLDIGGAANAEAMAGALEVINSDGRVRAILVNVFGGIVRCDDVARGVLGALERVQLASPIVVRLDGTRAAEAQALLAPHLSERLMVEPTMLSAARRAVELAGGRPMSIFADENTLVVVQGLTGSQGSFHGLRNRAYGTKVVAGVTPGKGGGSLEGIPIFDTVAEAVDTTGANASFVVVPQRSARPAPSSRPPPPASTLVVCITEHIPAKDEALLYNRLRRDFPRLPPYRPELSRRDLAGEVQHRHHRRGDRPSRRPRRHRLALGHAHLPGAARALAAGRRPDDVCRDRRRPGPRDVVHRRARRVRGRPRDAAP